MIPQFETYKRIAKFRIMPVWSGVWGQLATELEPHFRTSIQWRSYRSPYSVTIQRQHPEAAALMERARARQEADRKRKEEWLKENETVDAAPYVEKWDGIATEVRDQLLALAVETFPMMDGLEQANSTLKYGFEMKEAEISPSEFSAVMTSLFRLRVFQWSIKRMFPDQPDLQAEVMKRVAARELPTRDNVSMEKRGRSNVVQELGQLLSRSGVRERKPFVPFDKRAPRHDSHPDQ